MKTKVTENLISFVEDTRYRDFSEETVSEAKKCILDGIGVTVAGSNYEGMQVLRGFALETGGQPQARTIGASSIKTSALNAALINGVAGHVLDFDDTQIILGGHPTVVILPSLLALGEYTEASGQEMLTSFILGIEVSCKIARGVNPYHYQSGYHVTSTIGIFGAAAAAGKLLKLGHQELLSTLGIAGSMSSGLKENFGTMTKSLHVGLAASHAVMAALLAQKGCTASGKILEGDWGFGNVLSKNCQYDNMIHHLGNPWEIQNPGITRKKYPSCARTHCAIDALLKIVKQNDIACQDLTEIECFTDEDAFKILIHPVPKTELEAKFSMPFCLAIAFLEKDVSLPHFEKSRINDPKIKDLMKKIKHIPDEDIIAKGYEYRGTSKIRVKLNNGVEFFEMVETSKGDPRNPLRPDEIVEKFHQCLAGIIDQKKAQLIIDGVNHMEDQQNILNLVTHLAAT
jgi:2-methylcitrate dehydratase PrpD